MLLERLLDGLAVAVQPFALCRGQPGERLDLGRNQRPMIHYVRCGAGRLSVDGGDSLRLAAGAAAIVPAGRDQALAIDGAGALEVACGVIHATYLSGHGLFDYLPEPIVIAGGEDATFSRALDTLLDEMSHPRPGTEALSRALMQQCLVSVLRRYCESGECRVPWLMALEDERLGRALSAMLDHPEAPHSVGRLAETAGMSRSAFAEHFTRAFDRGPMDLLKEVRLRRAAALLATTELPIKAVAAAIGYDSRSHFSRVFHAELGQTPTAYRAARRQSAPMPG